MSVLDPARDAAPTVLIVEDDPEMLEYFERIVRDAGFRTLSATDGLMMLQMVRDSKPDAVVLDLMLPRYGGVELLFEMRLGAAKSIPVVVVTARYIDAAARDAIVKLSNVAAFFEKPVPAGSLVEALQKILPVVPPVQ